MAVEIPSERVHATGDQGRLRRRPTGAPPPLPREIGRSGRLLLTLVIVGGITTLGIILFGSSAAAADRFDSRFLSWLAGFRTPWLTEVMQALDGIDSRWPLRALRWATIIVLIVFRRWRHLLVFLGVLIGTEILT